MHKPKLHKQTFVLAGLVALLLSACGTSQIDEIPANAQLSGAFQLVGRRVAHLEPPSPHGLIVIIKDRHSTFPGFQRLRPQLRQVQRDNRLLVTFLVKQGFGLLGCEHPLGEVVENEETDTQYRLIRPRLKDDRELDEYGTYQPIRYQLMSKGQLQVYGVEDPQLFAADLEDFDLFARCRRSLGRKDLDEETREELARKMSELHRKMTQNIDARGHAAAENLIDLMEELQIDKSILLLGGAHVDAALQLCEERGFEVHVFQSSRYATEDKSGQPFYDIEDSH